MFFAGIAALAALLLLGLVYEQVARRREQHLALPGRMMEVDGYRLHVTDKGQGGPTVVLLHGMGDCAYSWMHAQNEVARFTRVLSYDRPGLGSSDTGPGLDSERTIAELQRLLTRTGAPGPYVLVGHSLGGLIARLYALRYPEQVAGMVLVDSTHEFLAEDKKFRQGMAAVAALAKVMKALSPFGLPRFLGQVLKVMPMYPERPYYQQQLSPEAYRQWTASVYRNIGRGTGIGEVSSISAMLAAAGRLMQQEKEGPPFGDMPFAVLTNPGFGEDWIKMQRELAARSANSVHRISDRSGHSIQMTSPELVVEAVRHVVDQARSRLSA